MRVVFHIGYPKTGTSWLQKNYFLYHPQIRLISNSNQPWNIPLLSYLIRTHERDYNQNKAKELLDLEVDRIDKDKDNGIILISAERLSGHAFSGGYDSFMIAGRIRESFPQSKIICVVRNQIEMVLSAYKQLVKEGYPGTIEQLIRQNHWRTVGFDLGHFKYEKLINKYIELMGRDKVCVLQHKLMQRNIGAFLETMCTFLNIEYVKPANEDSMINKSMPDNVVPILRRMNYFRKTELYPLPLMDLSKIYPTKMRKLILMASGIMPSGRAIMSEKTERFLVDYFQESNDQLSKLIFGEFIQD